VGPRSRYQFLRLLYKLLASGLIIVSRKDDEWGVSAEDDIGVMTALSSEVVSAPFDQNGSALDEDESSTWPASRWRAGTLGLAAAATSVVTVGGNLIVILSFVLERTIRQPPNYFIASLAVSDLLIGQSVTHTDCCSALYTPTRHRDISVSVFVSVLSCLSPCSCTEIWSAVKYGCHRTITCRVCSSLEHCPALFIAFITHAPPVPLCSICYRLLLYLSQNSSAALGIYRGEDAVKYRLPTYSECILWLNFTERWVFIRHLGNREML